MKTTSTRHTINKYVAFGANVGGGGTFAIMCTVKGSYGESIHRIFGNSYKDLQKCIDKALKYFAEGRQNVELLHLQSGKRLTALELLSLQERINSTLH